MKAAAVMMMCVVSMAAIDPTEQRDQVAAEPSEQQLRGADNEWNGYHGGWHHPHHHWRPWWWWRRHHHHRRHRPIVIVTEEDARLD
jgi:hypothetical protein